MLSYSVLLLLFIYIFSLLFLLRTTCRSAAAVSRPLHRLVRSWPYLYIYKQISLCPSEVIFNTTGIRYSPLGIVDKA